MGKTLFAAVLAAILASIATTLLLSSLDAEEKKLREEQDAELRRDMRGQAASVDVALARVERMEKRLDRATNAVINRVATNDGDGVTSIDYDTNIAIYVLNDAPTIASLVGDTLAYSEGDGAQDIAQGGDEVME